MRRIEPRPYRVGTGDGNEPESLEALQHRRDKHDRLTRGRPARAFSEILKDRLRAGAAEAPPARVEQPPPGAIDPHIGLDPRQDASLANARTSRSAKVIIKG